MSCMFLQAAPIATLPGNLTPVTNVTTMSTATAAPQLQSLLQPAAAGLAQIGGSPTTTVQTTSGPITIQLPTQPQPVQAVKSVTYVAARNNPPIFASSANNAVTTSSFQPVKLTTTGFAITPTGKLILSLLQGKPNLWKLIYEQFQENASPSKV